MNDIQSIYDMLNWKNSDETRVEGFRLVRKENNLSLLIMPPALPSVWEACAQVLSEKPDVVLQPYLNSLFEWLYDLNWPGARVILDRLKNFSGETIKEPFMAFFAYVNNLNNEEGLIWLDNLSELLDNEALKAVLPKEILEKLQKHYRNWRFWHDD